MKIIIAPDSFKESLSASRVAAALGTGVRRVFPDAELDLCPMADGGEGTVEAMVNATGGRFLTAPTCDPVGRPREAHFGLLGRGTSSLGPGAAAGQVAVIEMAAASGLELVPAGERNPMLTTTYGTGELILAALEAGAREILIGIGGSATVDGGCGCDQALGVKFLRADGTPCACGLAGGGLTSIDRIELSERDPRLLETRIRVACDVTNPLTGPEGAAAIFGPQKGATPEMVGQLDEGLHHLAEIIRQSLGVDVERMPGAGAAGGLGAGLVAFAGVRLERGIEIVAEAVGLADRIRGADLCITGEGRLDGQSAHGKTAVGVSRIAHAVGVPVICIPGQASFDAPLEAFDAVYPLVNATTAVAEALAHPEKLLADRAAEAVRS